MTLLRKKEIKNPQTHTMDKFSLRDLQRIAGSFDKLRQFKDGVPLESVFNSVRLQYPIRKYRDVFGYNSGMRTLKSNYLHHNKTGYYDSEPQEAERSIILNSLHIKEDDLKNIIEKTAYKVEGAVIYSSNKRYEIIGDAKNRVEVPIEILRNAHIIHSHPLGESFSVEDILEVAQNKAISIVAFNDLYIYKMTNNIQIGYEDFRNIVISVIDDTDAMLQEKIKRGIITKSQKDFSINHKVWHEISKKVEGFGYEAFKFKKQQ